MWKYADFSTIFLNHFSEQNRGGATGNKFKKWHCR